MLEKSLGAVTAHEAYTILALYLSRLPSRPDVNEMRQKVIWKGYMECLESQHACLPRIDKDIPLTKRQRSQLQILGLGADDGTRMSAGRLNSLVENLYNDYQLHEGELLQIIDLKVEELVDLYAVIENCADRFDEEIVSGLASKLKGYFSIQEAMEDETVTHPQEETIVEDDDIDLATETATDEVIGAVPSKPL